MTDARDTETLAEVLAPIQTAIDRANAMRPEAFKSGQDHLPSAFREVDFRAAFMALAEVVNEIEAALPGVSARIEQARAGEGALRERIERAERLIDAWEHDAPDVVEPIFIGRLREVLRRDPAPVRLRAALAETDRP